MSKKIHPAQLRQILRKKRSQKIDKLSNSIKNASKKWLERTRSRLDEFTGDKITLSLKYRIELKNKINAFLKHTKMNCSNLKTVLYFLDQKKISKKGLQYLGCGSNGCAFLGCIDKYCNNKIVVKIGLITHVYDYISRKKTHPNMVEIELYRLFNDIMLKNISHHYTFIYGSFDCNINILDGLKGSRISEFKIDANEKSVEINSKKILKLYIVEHANMDFSEYIKKHIVDMDHWKNYFFQICYMLLVTQYYIPGFRHNDFKPDNILVDIYPPSEKYIEYIIFNRRFYIKDIGVRLKMWDLDFGCADNIKNQKVDDSWSDKFGCTSEHNPIYDLHTIMNYLYRWYGTNLTQEVKDYILNYLTTTDEELLSKIKTKKRVNIDELSLIGESGLVTNHARLTGYKIGIKNLKPEDIDSPGDLFLQTLIDQEDTTIFSDFYVSKEKSDISLTFDSKIMFDYSNSNNKIYKRDDIFNTYLD